jgi:hypothetical protein
VNSSFGLSTVLAIPRMIDARLRPFRPVSVPRGMLE